MKKIKLALTGASGFLGNELMQSLDPSLFEIVILGRNKPALIDGLFFGKYPEDQIQFISCDLTNPDLITSDKDRELVLSCEYFYHGAAFYDLKGSYNDCFLSNVVATSNVLNFLKKSKKLKAFHYVSTVAVIDPLGNKTILEDSLPNRILFDDFYSQTKYAAEKLVREFNFSNDVKKIIYRPGVIVASSSNPKNFKKDGPYYFASALKQISFILNFLPFIILNFEEKANLPMVPVDHVARFIANSLSAKDLVRPDTTYHLVSDDLPTIPDFLDQIFSELGINTQVKNSSYLKVNKLLLTNLGIPKETIPFMFHCHSYDKSNTYRDFKEGFNSRYKDFKFSLLKSLKDV